MERTVGAFEARRNFGQILEQAARGDHVIVERHGEPVAAVVPIQVYRRVEQRRDEFFDLMNRIAERHNLDPDEADRIAVELVQEFRRSQRPE